MNQVKKIYHKIQINPYNDFDFVNEIGLYINARHFLRLWLKQDSWLNDFQITLLINKIMRWYKSLKPISDFEKTIKRQKYLSNQSQKDLIKMMMYFKQLNLKTNIPFWFDENKQKITVWHDVIKNKELYFQYLHDSDYLSNICINEIKKCIRTFQ